MMTTMAALLGGLPLALGGRDRLGTAPPAWHHDCRRPAGEPGPDALHYSGDLSRSLTAWRAGSAARAESPTEEPVPAERTI